MRRAVSKHWQVYIKGEVEPIGAVSADDEAAARRHAEELVERRRHLLSLDPGILRAEWIYLVPSEPDA